MIELSKTDFFWYSKPQIDSPLYECLLGGLRETYWSENHLIRTFLNLNNGTFNRDIQNLLKTQVENGKRQASRLEHVLELLDESIEARKCEAVNGLCKESSEILEFTDEGSATRDASIILVTERIASYEVSSYEGLIKIANNIGREDIALLLAESLLEEKICVEGLRALSEVTLQNAHVAA